MSEIKNRLPVLKLLVCKIYRLMRNKLMQFKVTVVQLRKLMTGNLTKK